MVNFTTPSYRLKQLAEYIGADIDGDDECIIEGIATLEAASKQHIVFYNNHRYKKHLSNTRAGCVLLHSSSSDDYSGNKLIIDDPYLAYAQLTKLFAPNHKSGGVSSIHPSATIGDDVEIGEGVTIGPNVVIDDGSVIGSNVFIYPGCYIGKNTRIGNGTLIYSNVSLYHDVIVGESCIFHSASIIGADGFGFAPSPSGWQKIYQLGGVNIGNNVEVGASTTIDRGALGDTIIDDGVKIDNQVHIGHNVQIGENTAIAGSTGIAGSTVIGKRCTIAGAVGIVGHISIADDVHVTAMTMVSKSISTAGSYSSGIPMNETRQWRKNAARFNQLDALARQLKSIKK